MALPEPLAVLFEGLQLLEPVGGVPLALELDELQEGQACLQLLKLLLVLGQSGVMAATERRRRRAFL